MTSLENIVCVMRPDELLHPAVEGLLLGQARGDELERQRFGVPEARRPFARRAPADIPWSSPLESPSENAKTVERSMPIAAGLALLDHALERLPLLVAPELRLLSAAHVCRRRPAAIAARRTRRPATCRRARCVRCTPARRRPRRRGALVEEDVNRPPARRERLRRGDRGEHRVLVVFAHRHDPEVDAVLAHQGRKERVEPLPSATPAASPPARAACRTDARASSAARRPEPGA